MGRGVLRHQRPGCHRLTQTTRTTKHSRAREGTGKRRYPLFFVADFSPSPTTTSRHRQPGNARNAAGDRQHIREAFAPCQYAPGNTPNTQKRHRRPKKPHQAPRGYRDTGPHRKTPSAAVKRPKRRRRPPPAPYACARAFIPRPVAFSITKDHIETARTAAAAPMSSAPSSERQRQSRPDQHPAGQHSRGHPSQE